MTWVSQISRKNGKLFRLLLQTLCHCQILAQNYIFPGIQPEKNSERGVLNPQYAKLYS